MAQVTTDLERRSVPLGEAAHLFGVCTRTMRRWTLLAHDPCPVAAPMGGRLLFILDDVESWLRRQTAHRVRMSSPAVQAHGKEVAKIGLAVRQRRAKRRAAAERRRAVRA